MIDKKCRVALEKCGVEPTEDFDWTMMEDFDWMMSATYVLEEMWQDVQ